MCYVNKLFDSNLTPNFTIMASSDRVKRKPQDAMQSFYLEHNQLLLYKYYTGRLEYNRAASGVTRVTRYNTNLNIAASRVTRGFTETGIHVREFSLLLK